jgi:hypothetical protein
VPQAYQYWHVQEPAKRRAIRDELVKRLKERARMMKSDADDSVRFKLLKQTWKGQKVIREGPSRTLFWVALNRGNRYTGFVLESDPIDNSRVACLPVSNANIIGTLWTTEGDVPLSSPLNTTKNTPSMISVLDQGAATMKDGLSSTHLELRLKGAKLHGVWVVANSISERPIPLH